MPAHFCTFWYPHWPQQPSGMDPHPSGGFYSQGWALPPDVPLTTGATGLEIYTL